jgi:adenosylcobinamide-GDP ribazoletransferase
VSGLLGAIQFLTRVPVRTDGAVPHDRVVRWFPVVGLLIGAVVGGAAAGLAELVPLGVAAALAVAVGLLVTGAFHEDGLADVADAFGGGWTREQRFEILKDSRHGTYGVAALATSIIVRVVTAASIASSAGLVAGFVAAHVLGRTAAVAAIAVVPPASDSGLGADVARSMRRSSLWATVAVGVALATVVTGWWIGPLAVTAALAVAAVGGLAVRKIGGIAGDVLGAVEQVAECLVLVVVSGLAARHQVWWA